MKLKLTPWAILVTIFWGLSSCSNHSGAERLAPAPIDKIIEHRPDGKTHFRTVHFYPHKGGFLENGITAEWKPKEKEILLKSPYPLDIVHATIEIIEEPYCGWVHRLRRCGEYHYRMGVNKEFVNCLDGTDNGIRIGFYY